MAWNRRYTRGKKRFVRRARRPSKRPTVRRFSKRKVALPIGLPSTYMCKMKYSQIITIDPAISGLSAIYTFRANSIYDPDLTGAGHQPMYRDEMALIYGKYCVVGSKITMTPLNEGSPIANPFYFGLAKGFNANDYSSITLENLLEQERTSKVLRIQDSNSDRLGNASRIMAKSFFSMKKNLKKNTKDDTVCSAIGNNPALQYYFIAWGCGLGSVEPVSQKFMIQIEYIVRFTEPIQPVQS